MTLSRPPIQAERLPHPIRPHVSSTAAPSQQALDRLRDALNPLNLNEKEQASLLQLQEKVKMFNSVIPDLRLALPTHRYSHKPYLSVDLHVCADYYFKCAHAQFDENPGSEIADLLNSLLDYHPLEWDVCGWKNDFVAALVLGHFKGSLSRQKEVANRWLKRYWKSERQKEREVDVALSPKRMFASSAIFDLEMLVLMDKTPGIWIKPGFRGYASFVNWLNKNWLRLACRKSGPVLMHELVSKFRHTHQVKFSDSELLEICEVYRGIESQHPEGAVPPYQVVLTLMARRHNVSPRLVNKLRAEQNRRRNVGITPKKARS